MIMEIVSGYEAPLITTLACCYQQDKITQLDTSGSTVKMYNLLNFHLFYVII